MPDSTDGKWQGVVSSPGIFAVHAMLLSNGNVLLFSGSVEASELPTVSFEWNPDQPITSAVTSPMPPGVDLFCAHHVNLDDGRVLVAGGSEEFSGAGYTGDWGTKAICIYDPNKAAADRWEKIGDMREGRWYPTLVTLPDGSLVTFSGIIQGNTHAATAEVFERPFEGPGYTTAAVAGGDKSFPSYPGMLLVRGGKVVHVGTTWQYRGSGTTTPIGTFSFRRTSPTSGVWQDEGVSPEVDKREEGAFVLLPPAQDGKILLLGGGDIDGSSQTSDAEIRSAEILHTQESPMRWQRLADMNHPRVNVSAVLLPDGKVLVIGGHDSWKWNSGLTPSNTAELYDPILGDDPSAWREVATMGAPRQYHSVSLLLPDGRVLAAGGVANDRSNQFTLELYEPPYVFNGARPSITSVERDDGPDDTLAYGGEITIETPEAADIRKIGLMRPGSMTHHTDTEQRYVALSAFVQEGTDRLRVGVVNDAAVAPPGHYMLWIVDDQNRPCDRARMVHLSARRCRLITDRSHVSRDELAETGATTFPAAFYVILDGFVPSELGVNTASPSPTELAAIAPTITFRSGSGEFIREYPEIVGVPEELLLEDDSLPAGVVQKVTFRFALRFDDDSPFTAGDGTPVELQVIEARAQKAGYSCLGDLTLTNQPNPFMQDGDTHWLSTDVRVFQMSEGDTRFGATVGASSTSATNFIQSVLTRFRNDAGLAASEFTSISTNQADSALELSRSRDGRRVFNFAIAKVRYRGRTLSATDVRVFFRMFTTAATGMAYSSGSTYRRGLNTQGDPVPLLGMRGGELVTIPYFATARVDTSINALTAQEDDVNRRTIGPTTGAEVAEYFGCWLDFNQSTLRFPLAPGGDGPYSSGLKSIQELIRGRHQCLVAEVHFDPDPIPEGETPASNDNLSQRNLAIVESDNPGSAASHTVEHSFEIAASRNIGIGRVAAQPPEFVVENQHGDHEHHTFPRTLARGEHDELMIRWGNTPRNSRATLFMPGLDAADAVALTTQKAGVGLVQVIDQNTLELAIADVTYVSLPPSPTQSIPALLRIELPDDVKRGQVFEIVVSQIDGRSQKILGSFELLVPVATAAAILPEAQRTLSVFKHIAEAIPPLDHWRPVFDRQLDALADKVRALGGDPENITASPDGDGILDATDHEPTQFCVVISTLLALLLGLIIGTVPAIGWLAGALLAAFATTANVVWWRRCRFSSQDSLRFALLALLFGLLVLRLLE